MPVLFLLKPELFRIVVFSFLYSITRCCSDQLMANANRHRRNQYWFQVIICRMYDVAVMNVRALMKMVGVTFTMVDLKRLLAHGLASKSVRPKLMPKKIANKLANPTGNQELRHRLDNQLHLWDTGATRRRCKVHRRRCETVKMCTTCDAPLCNGAAWERYHTMEDYKI